ncbi:SKA2 protein, partial [Calyptomena viridis]|nr:SKA2 protein [Calyptomena viridis]
FQKAESDLNCIQHKLECEIRRSLPENPAVEENPIALLEGLSVLKSRYKTLCKQLEKVFMEQQESMKGISAALENTTRIVQLLQKRAGLE